MPKNGTLRWSAAVAVIVVLTLASSAQAQWTCRTMSPAGCEPTFTDTSACVVREIAEAGIMPGCAEHLFCPNEVVTRGPMAVFLENAKHRGAPINLPAGVSRFNDVPASFPLACWIEQLVTDGITAGCRTTPPQYCPENPVTRLQMAIFISATISQRYGVTIPTSGTAQGQAFDCVNGPSLFSDVAVGSAGCKFVHFLYARGVTAGCASNPLGYCPNASITRLQMAAFLWAGFVAEDPEPPTHPLPACS